VELMQFKRFVLKFGMNEGVFGMVDRRSLLRLMALSGALLPVGLGMAHAETMKMEDLAVEGPLGDVFIGAPDAKVTIIEYASMTCSHCANFSTKIFPLVKEKYIDTGKVRFTLREFPFDPLATAAFMLARCKGNDKYYAMVDLLFAQQKAWTGSDKPTEALLSVVRQAGFTQESFETCLKNKAIYDGVNFVKERGAKVFGVDSTPTFFINGEKRSGSISIEDMDKILTPLLGG
jgi:protein-disulfide isomerase